MVRSKLSLTLVGSGYAILLMAAYLDNLRGPIPPILSRELMLSFEDGGWFLTASQISGIFANLVLIAMARKVSDRRFAIGASLLGLIAGAFAPLIQDFFDLMILAGLIGGALAAMGTVCNLLVVEGTPPVLRGRFLAGLHTMYGIGSFAAGMMVSETVSAGVSWHWLVLALTPLCLFMFGFFSWALPKDTPGHALVAAHHEGVGRLNRRQLVVIAIFILCVSGETTTSMWLSQFLVNARKLDPSAAAQRVSGFFAVMTLSRIVCFLWMRPKFEVSVLIMVFVASIASFTLGYFVNDWGFAFVGLIGPFFPIFLARISREFQATWKTLTMTIILGNQVALALMNLSIGWVGDRFGIAHAFAIAPSMLLMSLIFLIGYFTSTHLPSRPVRP